MKKHSVNYKAIEKQWLLSKGEFKRVLGHPLKLMFLLLLFFVLISVGQYVIGRGDTLPTIIIADEDGSVEVRTFIENVAYNKLKDVVHFEEVSLDTGMTKLNQNEAIGIIHIPEGTRDNLDTLEPSGMYLYVNDVEDIRTEFLIGYIQDMVDLLNKGQSGAMVYWREMSKQGVTYEERLEALNDISFDYGIAFLTRGDVFASTSVEDPLEGVLPIQYFGYGLLWLAVLVSSLFIQTSIITDRRLGIESRLLASGYTLKDYIISRVITGTVFAFAWSLVLILLFRILLGIRLLPASGLVAIIFVWIVMILNSFVVWFLMNSCRLVRLTIGIIGMLILLLTSGLLVPEFHMSEISKMVSQFNIINFGDNILKGYTLTTWRSLLPLIYTGFMVWAFSIGIKKEAIR